MWWGTYFTAPPAVRHADSHREGCNTASSVNSLKRWTDAEAAPNNSWPPTRALRAPGNTASLRSAASAAKGR